MLILLMFTNLKYFHFILQISFAVFLQSIIGALVRACTYLFVLIKMLLWPQGGCLAFQTIFIHKNYGNFSIK